MKTKMLLAGGMGLAFITVLLAQGPTLSSAAGTFSVTMVVTAESFHGTMIPALNKGDIQATRGRVNFPVTAWAGLQGDMAGLELYVVIDERVDAAATGRFEDLRRFILSQPATTSVGIAYMNNGEALIVQPPTKDHALAARALRLPSGNDSAGANPYTSLSQLVGGWVVGSLRREVLVVSDGVDVFEDVGGGSMYLDVTIADAQRAGVQIFCLYASSAGHAGHSPALIQGGQAYLAQLAEQTGGEAYFKPGEASASFEAYLADVGKHLSQQYRITFQAIPAAEQPGVGETGFERVTFQTRLPDVEVISAHGFYLNAK